MISDYAIASATKPSTANEYYSIHHFYDINRTHANKQ